MSKMVRPIGGAVCGPPRAQPAPGRATAVRKKLTRNPRLRRGGSQRLGGAGRASVRTPKEMPEPGQIGKPQVCAPSVRRCRVFVFPGRAHLAGLHCQRGFRASGMGGGANRGRGAPCPSRSEAIHAAIEVPIFLTRMSASFEELDYRQTPLGELVLRRRRLAALGGREVFEVKLGENFLMSSLFHEVEEALATLGLAGREAGASDVVVGGLGLGYTARAALEHPATRSVVVVDALAGVIEWHRRGLVPLGAGLSGDGRCRFVHGDFFALADAPETGFDPEQPGRRFDAVLLDIDHSPRHLLHPRHGAFYEAAGLRRLAAHLRPGGVFALWSDDAPDDGFLAALRAVFADARAQVVPFHNPLLEQDSASTVYVARKKMTNDE